MLLTIVGDFKLTVIDFDGQPVQDQNKCLKHLQDGEWVIGMSDRKVYETKTMKIIATFELDTTDFTEYEFSDEDEKF